MKSKMDKIMFLVNVKNKSLNDNNGKFTEILKRNSKFQHCIYEFNNKLSLELVCNSAASYEKFENTFIIGNIVSLSGERPNILKLNIDNINQYSGIFVFFYFSQKGLEVYLSSDVKSKIFFSINSQNCLFSSNLEMLVKFLPSKRTINLNYMVSFIRMGNLSSGATAFKKINELPRGSCILVDREVKNFEIKTLWSPIQFLNRFENDNNWHEDFVYRMELYLANIVNKQNVFLELSGGLESSTLCYFLSKLRDVKNFNLRAINLYNKTDPSSDERKYAKAVADELGVPISYLETSNLLPFSKTTFLSKPDKPSVTHNYLSQDIRIHKNICSIAQDNYQIISGHGGDSIFFAGPPEESIIDAILDKKYNIAKQKFHQLQAFYNNTSFYNLIKVLKIYFSYIINKKLSIFDALPPLEWLLYENKINQVDYLNPIYYKTKNLSLHPGDALQLENYYFTVASAERQLNTYYPFLSQLISESAFSIQTYNSFDSKYDRIMVRKSLAKLLGKNFSYRKSKGNSTKTFFKGVDKNFDYIKEVCLDGFFAQNNMIHKDKLIHDLNAMREGIMPKTWYISNLFCAELFLKEWDY